MALEIIGAGFGRTGNNFPKLALEQPGFGPCHHLFDDRAHAISVYRNHVAEAQADVPASRLLRDEVSQAWEPLRAFLDVEVPDAAFPRTKLLAPVQAEGMGRRRVRRFVH